MKLLGEELVAFRQTDGKVGVVGARCAHRRAHLFWGRNEENGIRCVYHGWKFDCQGHCIDMPSEPEESNFKDKVRIPAYPTYEVGGVVWAYLGPLDKKPAPPLFAWTQVPPEQRAMSKVWQQCNWLQALEGGIDTAHTAFLHSGRPPLLRAADRAAGRPERDLSLSPTVEVVPTDYGFCYGGIREIADTSTRDVRAYHWIMPFHSFLAYGENGGNGGHMWVPMDDENTMGYNRSALFKDPPEEASLGAPRWQGGQQEAEAPRVTDGPDAALWLRDARLPVGNGNEFGVDVDVTRNFRSTRNADNRYLIDRELQRTQTYSGIPGTNTQDRAIQESMGGIADRTLERLGTTDRAIIHARRALLKAVRTVQDGGEPPGVAPTYYKVRGYQATLPTNVNWFEAMRAKLYDRGARVEIAP
ncbi:MAG: Rieske 2Fe-2S domain-containing protein [Dehalococcoidia bacterium]|nr:Rieske 2Fe-2S domain-containing protein [Dehalococcoidia bacterium]